MDFIINDETSEILARIVRSIARKYGCPAHIKREFDRFYVVLEDETDKDMIPEITQEVQDMFINRFLSHKELASA